MKKLISLLLILAVLAGLAVPVSAAEADYTGKTVILYTGNIRGQIDLYPKIKALKDSYLAKGAEVLLVDTGNYLRGTAWANASMGADIYTLMDAVGYDAAGMGLAEFSYTDATTGYAYHGNYTRYYTQAMLQLGTESITYFKDKNKTVEAVLPAREPAGFPAICSCFEDLGGAYSFRNWYEFTTPAGLKLRIFAVADPAVPNQVQDGFLDPLPAPSAIDFEPVDLEITLSNSPADENADKVGLLCVPTQADATVGALVIDRKTGALTLEHPELNGSDPEMEAMAAQIKERTAANPDATVLFENQQLLEGRDSVNRREETDFGDLVTDALLWYAETYIDGWNKDLPLVAIQNGGNLDSFLYPGEVTAVDLLKALPFSPMGVGVIELTGAQLLETLEAAGQSLPCSGFAQVGGMKYTVADYLDFNAGASYGSFFRADSVVRTEITEIGGQAFDPEATYAVVADNFLMNGNDTYYTLKEAKAAGAAYVNNGPGVKTRDIVSLYVNQVLDGSVAGIVPDGRITVFVQPFTDVTQADYFYRPVLWALDGEITDGTSDTTFSPEQNCTRAQVVTFLWRFKKTPTPAGTVNPFGDTDPDAYFFKPVLWALEQSITDGTSDTTFSPDAPCTRAQVVTFLWRSFGCPAPFDDSCPFTDVDKTAYYYQAMLWAASLGITDGTSDTTFSPDAVCTRGQVVTFLYRANQMSDLIGGDAE